MRSSQLPSFYFLLSEHNHLDVEKLHDSSTVHSMLGSYDLKQARLVKMKY